MSQLEILPTELLEKVYFYSMNLDLARASPVIGGKLSSKTIYARTILGAFIPTWEEYYNGQTSDSKGSTLSDAKLQVSFRNAIAYSFTSNFMFTC